jgi:hypothetical protein
MHKKCSFYEMVECRLVKHLYGVYDKETTVQPYS